MRALVVLSSASEKLNKHLPQILVELGILYLYKVVLDIFFAHKILKIYGYQPYYFGVYGQGIDSLKLFAGYIMLALVWIISRPVFLNEKRPISQVFLAAQLLLILVPSLSMMSWRGIAPTSTVWVVASYLLLSMFFIFAPRLTLVPPPAEIAMLSVAIAIGLLIYVYFSLIVVGGLARLNFDFARVYEYRALYVQSRPPLLGYLVPWTGYTINIGILVYGLMRPNRTLLFLAIGLQVLLYGMTNYKSFLLLPALIVFFVVLRKFRWFSDFKSSIYLAITVSVFLFVVLLSVNMDYLKILFVLIERVYYMPAALHFLYFDYFTKESFAFFSGSPWINIWGLPSTYDVSPARLLAEFYWGRDFNPNAGWVAMGFANMGAAGILVYSAFLALYMWIVDSIAILLPDKSSAQAYFLGIIIALVNDSLTTAMITQGGLMAVWGLWTLSYFLRWKRTSIDDYRGVA